MRFESAGLTTAQFLAENWQRRPLLVRQAFPGFRPLLDADDVAGLACEEEAEARLVTGSYPAHDWTLTHGPFDEDDLRSLPANDWTLLVQDAEKHYPPLRSLMREFRFLPAWRIDDLMISVAATGGSVGPHVDQYDVFLLQAVGRRRWDIAAQFDPALLPGCELNVLESFEPEQSWVLEPGDVLYLPPGIAHHGVALEPGMTWSVGMRAPSEADLHLALGEWLAAVDDEGVRYRDPGLSPANDPREIDAAATERIRELANTLIGDASRFPEFVGEFLSRYRLAHAPAPPPEPIDPKRLEGALAGGRVLRHNPWTRLFWTRTPRGVRLFAAGDTYETTVDTARAVCDPERLERLDIRADQDLLCKLFNDGHLYLDTPE